MFYDKKILVESYERYDTFFFKMLLNYMFGLFRLFLFGMTYFQIRPINISL